MGTIGTVYILGSFFHVSISGFKWGRGQLMFFKLSSCSFPVPQHLSTVSTSYLSLKCFYFPSLSPSSSPNKKLSKAKIKLPESRTEFRFT